MNLYVEKETAGSYGLLDVFLNETVSLNTKTTYIQDITAVFKGFTNNFSIPASPNNIKLLGYFGYTEMYQPTGIEKRAKLFLEDGMLFREGIIKLQNTAWTNGKPTLFELEFSDGQKNLTEIFGEDTLSSLSTIGGDITWNTKNIQKALTSLQTASGGIRWFIPLVSVDRIFTLNANTEALQNDNIYYSASKPITSENLLLPNEIRPALFLSEILKAINTKYDISISPKPFIGEFTQLTDLCTMCTGANVAVKEVKAKITKETWDRDTFLETKFDIIIKPLIDAFELRYIGGGGDGTFGMKIKLNKTSTGTYVNSSYVNNLEVWEVDSLGNKKKKLSYQIYNGSETRSAFLDITIGLDIFKPEGGNTPSTLVKPLISIFVSADPLAEWKFTNILFDWKSGSLNKYINNNVQPAAEASVVNLFESLTEFKIIDFVKSIYTMFAYKRFKNETLNDFYYVPKTIGTENHIAVRYTNDLTPFADLEKVTKKPNTRYDGYNLKHSDSEYQQNIAFATANGMDYGQIKYPLTGKPKDEFKIETKFTAPVFNPIFTDADTLIYTFYPFGAEAKLNDAQTRFIYDTITQEFPIFYYNGVETISTPYGFVDTDLKIVKSFNLYHKISHKSNRIFTGTDNYISSLFNIITGDYVDQNTLYVQGYKGYIEDTLSGRKLIHTIDLNDIPSQRINSFNDNDEIIIKETRYTVLESSLPLSGSSKSKLILLNK